MHERLSGLLPPTGVPSVVYGKSLQKHQCNYTKAYGEPLDQSSFKCKLGRLRWLVILVPFKAMESTECSRGRDLQDTRHVLLHCTNQAGPRMRHHTQGSRRELDYRAYLTRPDLIPKAVRFMLETGLLGQFQTLPTTYRVTTTDLRQPAA